MSNQVHNYKINTYLTPTYCDYCSKFMFGIIKQGLKCEYCNKNFHKDCILLMPNVCDAAPKKQSAISNDKSQPEKEHTFLECRKYDANLQSCFTCNEKFKDKSESYYRCTDCGINIHKKCSSVTMNNCRSMEEAITEPLEETKDILSEEGSKRGFVRNPEANCITSKQVKLMRISQKIRKNSDSFWKGNMAFTTSDNKELRNKFWLLDAQEINIYDTSRMEKKLFTIKLEDVNRIELNLNNETLQASKHSNVDSEHPCVFTIQTSQITYFCGVNHSYLQTNARGFYNMLKVVFLPFLKGHRKSIKITAPKFEDGEIEEDFTIIKKDLLGSGQFGQVYSGINKLTKQCVAIKIISKTDFHDNEEKSDRETLMKNELTILCNLNHPGIVRLFALYDNPEKLYIVTEKMGLDMLEFIQSSENGRLSERVTKFIMYQIFVALEYLHKRDIAHCDLKPENILLVTKEPLPQVKICDFGYAKIIGENSFRRSFVGTAPYSPPEVKQRKTFNKSMDLWSMGVIMYVSLSGVFPFDEERDIYEQIVDANFLFPADPWAKITIDAINLITNELLHISLDRRAVVSKAMRHEWFTEDALLFSDLASLEKRVNLKWLVNKEQ